MGNKIDGSVEIVIPVCYLLQIACYGKMGSGDLPDLMKRFAQRILNDSGYSEELRKEQNKMLKELRTNLKNVLGEDAMGQVDKALDNAKTGLKFASALQNQKKDN